MNNQDQWLQVNDNPLTYWSYMAFILTGLAVPFLVAYLAVVLTRKVIFFRGSASRWVEEDRRYRAYMHERKIVRKSEAKLVKGDKVRERVLKRKWEREDAQRSHYQKPHSTKMFDVLYIVENIILFITTIVVMTLCFTFMSMYTITMGYVGLVGSIVGCVIWMFLVNIHMFRVRDILPYLPKPMRAAVELPPVEELFSDTTSTVAGSDVTAIREKKKAMPKKKQQSTGYKSEPGVRSSPASVISMKEEYTTVEMPTRHSEDMRNTAVPPRWIGNNFDDLAVANNTGVLGRFLGLNKDKKLAIRFANAIEGYVYSIKFGIKKHPILFAITTTLAIAAVILIYLLSFGACLCVQPFEMSSMVTRLFIESLCTPGTICFTYLNVPENLSTQMIVKFHTSDSPASGESNSIIRFGTSPDDLTMNTTCHVVNFTPLLFDLKDSRYVHTCDLEDLRPGTEYYFKPEVVTHVDSDGIIESISTDEALKFITLPDDPSHTVRFTDGGDMGFTNKEMPMLDLAISLEPDFITLGGDIAYTNGFTTCFKRWDVLFKYISTKAVSKSTGAMIPFLTQPGNHETRFNLFSSQPEDAINYLNFFSHRVGVMVQQGDVIPRSNLGAYHAHVLSNHTVLLSLDSGVITPHGAQVPWLNSQFKLADDRGIKNKITAYHAPLYPSSRNFDGLAAHTGRSAWESVFNEGRVALSLEHHDHTFKRTKPLLAGIPVASGTEGATVYIGDGSMGVHRRDINPTNLAMGYMEKSGDNSHVWLISCSKDGIHMQAILGDGSTLDEYTI